jgi:hypothetical protein
MTTTALVEDLRQHAKDSSNLTSTGQKLYNKLADALDKAPETDHSITVWRGIRVDDPDAKRLYELAQEAQASGKWL